MKSTQGFEFKGHCETCKHFIAHYRKDSQNEWMGVCCSTESVFKSMFRVELNSCSKHESYEEETD